MKRLPLLGLLMTCPVLAVAPEDVTEPGKPPKLHPGTITTTDGNLYHGFSFQTTRGWRYVVESSDDLVNWTEEPSIYGLGQQQTLLMRETGFPTITPPTDATPAPAAPANRVQILLRPAASPATGIIISWPSLAGGSYQVKHFPSLSMDTAWSSLSGYVRRFSGYDFQIASPPMSETPPTDGGFFGTEDTAMLTAFESNFAAMNQDVIDEVVRISAIPKVPMAPQEKRFWRVRAEAPDSDLDGTPDWLEYGQLFGTQPAPGGIGEADPAPANPFSADADNNGVPDGDEKDSDGDGLADALDPVPDDPLIYWERTSPVLLAAWLVEPPSGKSLSAPIQINDVGDVLFNDFIWSKGIGSPLTGTANITELSGAFLDDNGTVYARGKLGNSSGFNECNFLFRLNRSGSSAQSIIDSSKNPPVYAGIPPQFLTNLSPDMITCAEGGSYTFVGGAAIEEYPSNGFFHPWSDQDKPRHRWKIAANGTATIGAGESEEVMALAAKPLTPVVEAWGIDPITNYPYVGDMQFESEFDRIVMLPGGGRAVFGKDIPLIESYETWAEPKNLPLLDFATEPGFGLDGQYLWQNGRELPFSRYTSNLEGGDDVQMRLKDTTPHGWTLATRGTLGTPQAVYSCLSFSVEGATPGSGVDNASIDAGYKVANQGQQKEFWVMVPATGSKTVRIRSGASQKTPIALSSPHLAFEPATLTSPDQQVTLTSNGVTEDLEEDIVIKVGDVASLNMIFKVKFLKERTVTVRVWKITSDIPGSTVATANAKDPTPNVSVTKEPSYNPTNAELEAYLEGVYGPQLNVKFKVRSGNAPNAIQWDCHPLVLGTGDRALAKGNETSRSDEQKRITGENAPADPICWDRGADINVYWVGSLRMIGNGSYGYTNPTERMVWLTGNDVGTRPHDHTTRTT